MTVTLGYENSFHSRWPHSAVNLFRYRTGANKNVPENWTNSVISPVTQPNLNFFGRQLNFQL